MQSFRPVFVSAFRSKLLLHWHVSLPRQPSTGLKFARKRIGRQSWLSRLQWWNKELRAPCSSPGEGRIFLHEARYVSPFFFLFFFRKNRNFQTLSVDVRTNGFRSHSKSVISNSFGWDRNPSEINGKSLQNPLGLAKRSELRNISTFQVPSTESLF